MIRRSGPFRHLATRCIQVADEVADVDDFVAIRSLLKWFRVSLVIRPLLVEAMIATSNTGLRDHGGQTDVGWCLLLDRDTFPIAREDLATETSGSPLPVRLRNTIAHELAHTLAFRPTEFGVASPKRANASTSRAAFVASIEQDTEGLSPLLLLPERLLRRIFVDDSTGISAQDLHTLCGSFGVSRYVLINRLSLLDYIDAHKLRFCSSLVNTVVGLGEWVSTSEARLLEWPLFSNFEGGKAPGFIFELQKRRQVPAASVFPNRDFYLCGGSACEANCTVPAGTPRNPSVTSVNLRCTAEEVPRKAGSEFLFTVQLAR